jgi:nitroreductase
MNAATSAGIADLRPLAAELAGVARQAPSLHNAQPWAFQVGPQHVDVLIDRTRLLPAADPTTRQAHLGLGATAYLLRLKLSTLDCTVQVEPWPVPGEPDLVVRLRVTGQRPATETEQRLLAAVPARRTVRTPFTAADVPVPLHVAWSEAAEAEGAGLRWVARPGERIGVAALVATAEHLQQRDPAYLDELHHWTAPTTLADGAGIPPSAFGVTSAAGHTAEFPLRDFAGGRETDRPRHVGPTETHPVVAVLQTAGDRPQDWLTGGQALMRVLLAAAADGYAASYLNQPLELPALRRQLRDELRLDGWPQLVLRLGHPAGALPPQAPRRPIPDTLLPPT